MNEKDFILCNQINTLTKKLELFSLAFGLDFVYSRPGYERPDDERPDDEDERRFELRLNNISYSVLRSELGVIFNETIKSLDSMKKCIKSEEYKKTLYIDVIKRIYIFIREDESGYFESCEPDGSPIDYLPDFQGVHKELVEGMWKLSTIFDEEATDILRKLLDYLEKANLPIEELPWEYQALVNSIIGTVNDDYGLNYLIKNLDEILIECSIGGCIPNIGEPVLEEEKDE